MAQIKTAVQQLIEDLELIGIGFDPEQYLVKERQDLIEAGNNCSNTLIANEIVINGNHELSVGENYFNQTFNQ